MSRPSRRDSTQNAGRESDRRWRQPCRQRICRERARLGLGLRRAGVEAILQVFEGQGHAQFLDPTIPETKEAFDGIAAFLDRHLA